MTLIFDRRTQFGDAPGFHALIVGVNAYPYLQGGTTPQPETYGMGQVTSPVPSALRFYEWLLGHQDTLRRPLLTCRLLLSPAPEAATPPVERATCANFRDAVWEWRDDASHHEEGGSVFYFVGHGAEHYGKMMILLDDFNAPNGVTLQNAVDTDDIFRGMSPTQREKIARAQFYFVDACRVELEDYKEKRNVMNLVAPPLWDLLLNPGREDRCAPFFYAALPGTPATARPNTPTIFNQALLSSLDRAAESPEPDANGVMRWPVRVYTLDKMLRQEMDVLLRESGGYQTPLLTGQVDDREIHFLDRAPEVPVNISITPATAAPSTNLTIKDFDDMPVMRIPAPLNLEPFEIVLPVGYYKVLSEYKDPASSSITQSNSPLKALYRFPLQEIKVKGPTDAGAVHDSLHVVSRNFPLMPRPPVAGSCGDTRMYIRVFGGNPLEGETQPQAPGHALHEIPGDPGQGRQFMLRNSFRGIAFVQVLQPGQPTINIAVPAAPDEEARLVLRPCSLGGPAVNLHLGNPDGDSLLDSIGGAEWKKVEALTKPDAFDAQMLLFGKVRDPVAATMGAYALLRLGEIVRLHDWTSNLCNWFDWLPDGAAIHGEHMALLGRHEEAVKAFMKVSERGLPIFHDGLALTLSRLRFYIQAKNGPAIDVAKAQADIARMEPFLLFADLSSPLLSYTGFDPSKPGREVAEPPENPSADWFIVE